MLCVHSYAGAPVSQIYNNHVHHHIIFRNIITSINLLFVDTYPRRKILCAYYSNYEIAAWVGGVQALVFNLWTPALSLRVSPKNRRQHYHSESVQRIIVAETANMQPSFQFTPTSAQTSLHLESKHNIFSPHISHDFAFVPFSNNLKWLFNSSNASQILLDALAFFTLFNAQPSSTKKWLSAVMWWVPRRLASTLILAYLW